MHPTQRLWKLRQQDFPLLLQCHRGKRAHQRSHEVVVTFFPDVFILIIIIFSVVVNCSSTEGVKAMATISSVKFNVYRNAATNLTLHYCRKWKSPRKSVRKKGGLVKLVFRCCSKIIALVVSRRSSYD